MLPPYYPAYPAPPRPGKIRLVVLGSGSPEPSVRRASSGCLATVGADNILMDCGGGVFDRLLQAGVRPAEVGRVFFSHLHSDHMMDYARLVHAAWDASGTTPKVFGPAPLREVTEKLFGRDGAFAHDFAARIEHPGSRAVWKARGGALPRPWPAPEVTELSPGDSVDGNEWRVSTCQANHAQPFLESVAFRLETSGGAAFVCAGDAAVSDETEALAKNADLLLHWCYRFSDDDVPPELAELAPTPGEIAAMAARAGVRRLLLTHLRPAMDAPGRRARALAEAREVFKGEVAIAEDLTRIDIDPPAAHSDSP